MQYWFDQAAALCALVMVWLHAFLIHAADHAQQRCSMIPGMSVAQVELVSNTTKYGSACRSCVPNSTVPASYCCKLTFVIEVWSRLCAPIEETRSAQSNMWYVA